MVGGREGVDIGGEDTGRDFGVGSCSRCAGSIETVSSRPLISSMEYLSFRLITLQGPL